MIHKHGKTALAGLLASQFNVVVEMRRGGMHWKRFGEKDWKPFYTASK
jgi:hypothetical protein